MSGNRHPLNAKYPDRVLAILSFQFNGANPPTIVVGDGFNASVATHTGGTGVYGFELLDKHAAVAGSTTLKIAAVSAQYFTNTEVNATTKAVTLTTLTEAGVATEVTAGTALMVLYCVENPLPPT
jgi:hypothetical protein